MDITPVIPSDRKIIQAYSQESFKINDERFFSNLIVMYNEVLRWDISDFDSLTIEDFNILNDKNLEILLIGCGLLHKSLKPQIKYGFKNLSIEVMNTGAACRTYNILLAEGRLVGAALILPK